MGLLSVDWNLNWPAEGSLTQANLQRFHFCGEELSVRGAVFPGSTMPPLLLPACPALAHPVPDAVAQHSVCLGHK